VIDAWESEMSEEIRFWHPKRFLFGAGIRNLALLKDERFRLP
jgi:hypothetical protein